MPIKVACKCGQSFAVKDEMAGKTLKCPKCQQPLPIPARSGAGAAARPVPTPAPFTPLTGLFDEAGFKEHQGARCPQCGEPLMKSDAVLCTHCGFHLQSGQKVEGAKVYKQGERGFVEAADSLLDRAAKQIEVDKVEAKKTLRTGMPAWMLFLALAGLISFVVAMFMIPRETAFLVSGWTLFGFCVLMEFICYVRMVLTAFSENNSCGFLFIFMPFYGLYYVITRWDKVGGLFLIYLFFNVVSMFAYAMVLLSPMMAADKNEQSYLPIRPNPSITSLATLEPGMKT